MKQPTTRNWIAVAAKMRNSAGAMEPKGRRRRKRDRKAAKQALRKGEYNG